MTPAAVARAYFEAFSTADPHTIASCVTEDFVNEHTAGLGSGCETRGIYEERLAGFLSDMVDLRYEIEDLVADGDQVAVFYRMTAKWQGQTAISVRGAQRLVVRDGLICHRTDYWDSSVFLDQIA